MTTTTIDLERTGSAAILRLGGDITSASDADLTAGFGRAIDDGARAVILDFARMEYMNSGGIGLLVTLLVRAQRAGARLMAVGLSDHYRQILSLTRLDEAIEVHDDETTAMAAIDLQARR
jgi:anti-anti-sigma factor